MYLLYFSALVRRSLRLLFRNPYVFCTPVSAFQFCLLHTLRGLHKWIDGANKPSHTKKSPKAVIIKASSLLMLTCSALRIALLLQLKIGNQDGHSDHLQLQREQTPKNIWENVVCFMRKWVPLVVSTLLEPRNRFSMKPFISYGDISVYAFQNQIIRLKMLSIWPLPKEYLMPTDWTFNTQRNIRGT